MKGEWVMFRLKAAPGERGENWMLKKVDDEYAKPEHGEALVENCLTSVTTGRTMAEIAAGSRRLATRTAAGRKARPSQARGRASAPPQIPARRRWRLWSMPSRRRRLAARDRNMTAIAACSRSPAARRRSTPAPATTGPTSSPRSPRRRARSTATARLLDGEIVALDEKGKTGFSALQQAITRGRARAHPVPVRPLEIDGEDLDKLPNLERKERLAALLGDGRAALHPLCRPYRRQGRATVRGDVRGRPGRDHLEEGRRALSRRADARTGSRSNAPAPGIRHHRLDARATRRAAASARCCSALNEGGKLSYAGKVGTGFSQAISTICATRLRPARGRRSRRPRCRAPRRAARIG